jgi:hypothetical protein
MRYFSTVFVFVLFIINIAVIGSAEYVFKKDGVIIKGRILNEDNSAVSFRSESGVTMRINRGDVMRVLYTDLYMGKVYVRLTSGEVLEVYQVDEDRDGYTFRKDINKPAEFTILRKKVMFIARTNPTDLTGESFIDRIKIRWSPPFKPAKLYKVYMREFKKGEKFRIVGETDDLSYTMKKLARCTGYEIYVTAIGDGGEESLPSEKITASTLPYPPEDLKMTEKYSDDGKSVTLTMTWKPVTDPESRVKSYAIYKTDNERKKLGTTKTNEFVIKNFPVEGINRFALVAVNDVGTESDDVKTVFDPGYKIYTRVSGVYIVPFGDLAVIADSGYGGLLDIGIGKKMFSAGIETGYMSFNGTDSDIKSMSIIPLLVMADYRIPMFFTFSLRPVIKVGAGYCMTETIIHPPAGAETSKKDEFSPMGSFGLFMDLRISDFYITGGAEYSGIFQKSGTMTFAGGSFGVGAVF